MADPLSQISTTHTAQTQPIPSRNQVKNSAGGFVFELDGWAQLERFLMLGSWGGTYYTGEKELTKANAENIFKLVSEDGRRVVDTILAVSLDGRAYKQNPTLFTLAVASAAQDAEVRSYALSKVSDICRTGTMFFQYIKYAEQFRGWGRGLSRTAGEWYTERTPDSLATQLIKYRQREGWSHKDVLYLAKPKTQAGTPVHDLVRWAAGKSETVPDNAIVQGYLKAQSATTAAEWVAIINEYHLPWEALPTQALNCTEVWEALVPTLGLTAILRNMGKMGATGMTNHSTLKNLVQARIINHDEYRKARVHPMQVLLAATVYAAGRGVRGGNTWNTVPSLIDNLNDAFYASFGTLEVTNKRRMIALDVSGSMGGGAIANTFLTPREATGALAMVALNQDPDSYCYGFSSTFVDLKLSAKMRLDDVRKRISGLPFNSTDCSLPMEWAIKNNVELDSFEIYTDNETYAGARHPVQALKAYRDKTGINAKLVVNGMTATNFSIADPTDGNSMDVVGFDAAAPRVISSFINS